MPAAETVATAREALIVATEAYEDPKLRALRAPARDAEELARVLGDPGIGDFRVGVSLNEPDHVVRRKISEFFRDRGRDDLLLLHISCHGLKDEDGTLYFASANTAVELLEATAIPSEFVNRQMTKSRSRRIVLLLDCCFGGAFARGMVHRAGESVAIKEEFDGQGRVVLTASRAMEYAFEGDQLEGEATPSVFTSAIVEGLESGEADRDHDSRISVDELYDYVYDRVREATPHQTPSKWTFDVQGDLFVARSPFTPAVEEVTLPPELRAATESPFAHVRAGAVMELSRFLRGPDERLAEAARLALETLVEDDSRRVSEAAADALSPPAPAPSAASPQVPAARAAVAGEAALEERPAPPAFTRRSRAAVRIAGALPGASRWSGPLALGGAAAIVLGYFRNASWDTAWGLARQRSDDIWAVWSPPEAFGAALLVAVAVLAARRGRLRRESADGVLLGTGAVVFAAMIAFVAGYLEFGAASRWTGLGALAIAAAGALGALTRRGPEVELRRYAFAAAVAGTVLGLAPLVVDVIAWDNSTLVAGGPTFSIEVLGAGVVAIVALVALGRSPHLRLFAGGVLLAVGALLTLHLVGLTLHVGFEEGFGEIGFGAPIGILGGLVLAFAAVRVLRSGRTADLPVASGLPAT